MVIIQTLQSAASNVNGKIYLILYLRILIVTRFAAVSCHCCAISPSN